MSDACAYLKIYDINEYPELTQVNKREIRRYAGMAGANLISAELAGHMESGSVQDSEELRELDQVMSACIEEALPILTYRVSYRKDSIIWEKNEEGVDTPKLPFGIHGSRNVIMNLEGCSELVMFAATIGIGIDRLISKYSRVSPVKALFLQAIGAERIEALCDLFNKEIVGDMVSHPRFSPGYGDLPLDVQKEFFGLLDCQRRLGLTLNDSLLMSPSKSVTAFIGIESGAREADCRADGTVAHANDCDDVQETKGIKNTGKCASCYNLNCEYRES